MTLHHFTHQAIDGAWHCVYRNGRGELVSIGDCPSAGAAQELADAANCRQRAMQTHDRTKHRYRIPAGFYTDKDAA